MPSIYVGMPFGNHKYVLNCITQRANYCDEFPDNIAVADLPGNEEIVKEALRRMAENDENEGR